MAQSAKQPDFQAGLSRLAHRGPNDRGLERWRYGSGEVVLGHTRLSIIDLSDAGHQPMQSRCGRYVMVFNGEIYNYRELRRELLLLGQYFVSDSDTEVLLASWVTWGKECISRLCGMFAFVVFDKLTGKLTCVRDAFGIKPLYYVAGGNYFRFASEIPALLHLLPEKPTLDWQTACDYILYGQYDNTDNTFVAGIKSLPSGYLIEVDAENGLSGEPEPWWYPQIQERPGWNFNDAVEQVREQFLMSVRLHLRSDVPLGAALSGGVDSSAIVCAVRFLEPDLPIHTFSYIADDTKVNEEQWINCINTHVGAIEHKVHITSKELAFDLDEMIRSQGEPFGGTSIYAQFRVFKLARDCGVIVLLDGQGADETLAGYSGFPGQRMLSLLENSDLKAMWDFANAWSKWPDRNHLAVVKSFAGQCLPNKAYSVMRRIMGYETVPDWINYEVLREHNILVRFPRNKPVASMRGRRVISELANSLRVSGLPSLLRHSDRNAMHYSIESRVPFLTTDLVDLLFSMPEEFLISSKGETKHVFRAAMRGIVPDRVLTRRDKIGFVAPEKNLLLSMPDTVREWLKNDLNLPFLNHKKIMEELNTILDGSKPYTSQVWRWVNFYRWYGNLMGLI